MTSFAYRRRAAAAWLALLLGACAAPPTAPPVAAPPPPAPAAAPAARPLPGVIDTEVGKLVPVAWSELVDFDTDPLDDVSKAFRFSCQYLGRQTSWAAVCGRLSRLAPNDQAGLRALLHELQPYRIEARDGDPVGTITGYFEPVLRGSRVLRNPYYYPLYSRPVDLIAADPKKNQGVSRGRMDGAKLVPYWSRAQMLTPEGQKSMSGREIVWVDDPMDDVLIEVQGSGRVLLPDGSAIRLTYIDHNGWPFRPLFQWFKETGTLKNPNMVQISQWARSHPYEQVRPMLNSNPQVVFFKWEPVKDVTVGPPGAAGVPLVPMRSIAVDPKSVPLAAPVWIDFKSPISDVQYRRLVFAHDTGGAIKGAVRADYFWGFGQQAGELAAKTRQTAGRMWVLLPRP
ncbi:MAG: MltA domain-containing protein [Betaproteobacteria bacterium]|nr:MltA domain-containing protein [Betaproteobacteria bacterium]